MASTTCPFCDRFSHFTIAWAATWLLPDQETEGVQGVGLCDHCGRASIAVAPERLAHAVDGYAKGLGRVSDRHIAWIPQTAVSPQVDDVPPHIEKAAKEAYGSLSVGNNMAAILMARTVIEATAKAKGIASGNLFAKIDALRKADHIRPSTAEAAHEVRHLGNDMAHGDLEDVPDADDASDILALMAEVLNEVFQGPARTARVKARRTGVEPE